MSFDFTGKTAIVTGTAHGFGRAIAKALKRLGTPDDVANGVLFFASDLAGWITSQVLSIDGGK